MQTALNDEHMSYAHDSSCGTVNLQIFLNALMLLFWIISSK